jgi:hypothetical protein
MDMPHTYKACHNLNLQGINILLLIVDFIILRWGYKKMSIFLGTFFIKVLKLSNQNPTTLGAHNFFISI